MFILSIFRTGNVHTAKGAPLYWPIDFVPLLRHQEDSVTSWWG